MIGAGLTTMLKLLSTVFEPAVALKVNVSVVEELTSVGSPEISPVDEFNESPAPVKTEVVSE